jgi:hypothetical protein
MLGVAPRPALGRPRWPAACAQPFYRQLDLLRAVTGRQRDAARRHYLIEADDLAAVVALEVRVVPCVLLLGCVEAPYPVVTRDPVGQSPRGEPFQHAIDRHAVYAKGAIHLTFDLAVRERAPRREQYGEHPHARAGDSRPGAVHHLFRTIEKGSRHVLTPAPLNHGAGPLCNQVALRRCYTAFA